MIDNNIPTKRNTTYTPDEVARKSSEDLYEISFNKDQKAALEAKFAEGGGGSSSEAFILRYDEDLQVCVANKNLMDLDSDHIPAYYMHPSNPILYPVYVLGSVHGSLVLAAIVINPTADQTCSVLVFTQDSEDDTGLRYNSAAYSASLIFTSEE